MNDFNIHGQMLQLLPEGAAFLPEHSALILADVHLGKSAAFRAKGLPVPEGDTVRDLERILSLSATTQARQLVIAGDFFHAPSGITPEIEHRIHRFLHELKIPFHLVSGNHDAKLKHLPCSISSLPFLDLGQVRIVHDPKDVTADRLCLTGHWHPVVKIRDGKRTSLRLPCFLLREKTLVLPAFGSFTGGAMIPLEKKDRVFVSLREKVIELPDALKASS